MDNEALERKKKHVAEEYLSSLSDLQCNSKPLINVLTMLAEENIELAPVIVKVVEQHITKVPTELKLPILYLIDSIVKNVKNSYVMLFGQCIVNIFCHVFEKVNEKTRERMYALRQTWNEVFPASKLYSLDTRVNQMDKNWPVTAIKPQQPAIHVNPNFLKSVPSGTEIGDVLKAKTRELLELRKRKLELELEATKKHLEEQEKTVETNDNDSNLLPCTSNQMPAAAEAIAPVEHMPASMSVYGSNYVRPAVRMPTPSHAANQHNMMPTMGPQLHSSAVVMPTNLNKVKVHPVNPALLNSIRQRDPRLMRQHMQQQQQLQQHTQQSQHLFSNMRSTNTIEATNIGHNTKHGTPPLTNEISKRDKQRDGGSKTHKSSSRGHNSVDSQKSTTSTRHTTSSQSRTSQRSSSKSASSSLRDRERERKRGNEGKRYNSSSSERRHQRNRDKQSSKSDKSSPEISSSPSSSYRHSKSPNSSPIKSRDTSRRGSGNKTTNNNTKNGQIRRSNSPLENIVSSTKDVDLRSLSIAADSSNLAVEPLSSRSEESSSKKLSTSSSSTSTVGGGQTVKGLEQKNPGTVSTLPATASSITTSSSSSSSTSSSLTKNNLQDNDIVMKNVTKLDLEGNNAAMDIDDDEDIDAKSMDKDIKVRKTKSNNISEGKKRISEGGASEEPIAKKSKSANKMDALFGSEDVDLRTLAPPIMTAPIAGGKNEVLVAPPPPIISSSDDDQNEDRTKSRENVQSNKSASSAAANSNVQQKIPASFEDVRAKFAKATKIDRLSKSERPAVEKTRARLAEVYANEDENTQEANDEKIRIILSQAQEMLDSNSINKEQYKQLVQTVMSINEKTKLKEAKRRESLQQQNTNTNKSSKGDDADNEPTILVEDGDAAVDVELMAARDAVLRKRIPKLSKKSANVADEISQNKSPIAVDLDDECDEAPVSSLNRQKPKEKRSRRSKWNESVNGGVESSTSQRPWQTGPGPSNSKRNNMGMRGTATPIPPPPQPPLMIVGPNQLPLPGNWTNNANAGGLANMQHPMGFAPNATPQCALRSSVPPPPQPPLNMPPVLPAIPPNNLPKPCNSIDNPQADLVRTIHIDGQSKDIRIYDDVAIVFMDRDEPREIGFQPGQRAIIIDNQDPFTLRFNDEYKPIMIAGQVHRVRFGFPSRELYIDEDWYEIYFGGPPVSIPIKNTVHVLKAEGPPPQVTIGPVRRDLVVGRITMIVEAVHIFTLFLDARIQTFRYKNEVHTVQFADNLLTVLLDGKPQEVVYGGLPKPFILSGKRYFIRFTTLPDGVVAGKVYIKDMIYVKTEPPARIELPVTNENSSETTDAHPETAANQPTKTEEEQATGDIATNSLPAVAAASLDKINIDELLQKLVSTGILSNNNVGKLSKPAVVVATSSNVAKVTESSEHNDHTTTTSAITTTTDSNGATNVSGEVEQPEIAEEEKLPPIIPIDLSKPESIKTRQEAIVSTLYSGMQCSSCGVRFPPEQTIKYSQHLDWHFRQNRRERDSTRKVHSRKWYYELNDWLQYEEIEDLDEREKNFFETQQCELDALDDISNQRSTNSPQPTCAAGPDDVDRTCDMCHEKFEQFYNEELEEWHLRLAMRVEDKYYHPLCYEDYKASLNPPAEAETEASKSTEENIEIQGDDNAVDDVIKIEEDENGNQDAEKSTMSQDDDDDDDVIVLPNEEPSVTEIVDDDDEEYVPVNVTREEMRSSQDKDDEQGNDESAMESDVEIQEPHIPFTDLDTYVEKELPEDDSTQSKFKNIKIKEEPKEEDEDDGFEDVGTVMYGPHDEISIQSSEETQTHTIISSVGSPATISGDPSPATNMFSSVQTTDAATGTTTKTTQHEGGGNNMEDGSNISMDGNPMDPADGHHNLSISGPPPAVPLGSLVNKIKINITKTSATANASSLSTTETTTTTTTTISNLSSNNNNEAFNQNSSNTHVISTIPVLCGGSSAATTSTSSHSSGSNSIVSNITVIGSYGSSYQQQSIAKASNSIAATALAPQQRQRTPTPPPPPVEETITFDLKPALQKATLKKMKKVECGIETSGLCSIM